MQYIVANSIFQSRDEAIQEAIDWWASACWTQDIDPTRWTREEIEDFLPGWCKVKVDLGEPLDEEEEQKKLDEEVIARAICLMEQARRENRSLSL